MYKPGDVVRGGYVIVDIPATQGGMGKVAFVRREADGARLVMKYCDELDPELKNRFRREVRLLNKYRGSDFVVPIITSDLENDPPMFVMALASGDLSSISSALKNDLEKQERVFLRMIDCVEHLHKNGDRHRDIKPHNFLLFGDRIVVSDLGLAKDPSSETEFTKSVDVGGTFAFSPPQFYLRGGFKDAEPSDDIYMLGKSFYYLLTGLNPYHLVAGEINGVLFRVIDRCCQPSRDQRYQNCELLRAAVTAAFDILLGRKSLVARYEELKAKVLNAAQQSSLIPASDLLELFERLSQEEEEEQISMIEELPTALIERAVLAKAPDKFWAILIELYWKFLQYAYSQRYYPFSHAEKVARQMALVNDSGADVALKAKALHVALDMAIGFNRGAAAETCAREIEAITDDALAFAVVDVLKLYGANQWYLQNIDLVKCQHFYIRQAVKELRGAKAEG